MALITALACLAIELARVATAFLPTPAQVVRERIGWMGTVGNFVFGRP